MLTDPIYLNQIQNSPKGKKLTLVVIFQMVSIRILSCTTLRISPHMKLALLWSMSDSNRFFSVQGKHVTNYITHPKIYAEEAGFEPTARY